MVNPDWRELERRRRSIKSSLDNRRSRYAALDLHPETNEKKIENWATGKGALVEEIQTLEQTYEEVRSRLKETPSHVSRKDLPESSRCQRLASRQKQLQDTIKFVVYRTETAMVNLLPRNVANRRCTGPYP